MKWISIKDKLPKIGEAVICAMKTDDGWRYGCCVYREHGFPWIKLSSPHDTVEYYALLPGPPEEK